MSNRTDPRVSIDRTQCVGHGRCYAFAPQLFEPDDEGYAVVIGSANDEDLRAALDMAVRNCPEHAVVVSDDPV